MIVNKDEVKKLSVAKLILPVILFLLLISYLTIAHSDTTNYRSKKMPNIPIPKYKPNEVLVQYKPTILQSTQNKLNSMVGASTVQTINMNNKPAIKVLKLGSGTSVEDAVASLRANSGVLYAEPNYTAKAFYFPNDNWFPKQWSLYNTGQLIDGLNGIPGDDINMVNAWNIEKGESNPVTVAVIDTGIDISQPDITRLWTNPSEVPGNGIDDDNNGYVDDINGYNFAGIGQSMVIKDFGLGQSSEGGSNNSAAQSITGTGQTLSHFGFQIVRAGLPPSDIHVSVREDSYYGNEISTTTIYRYEVGEDYYNSGDEKTEIYKTLDTPVTLENGRKYFIVLSIDQSDRDRFYILPNWQIDANNNFWDPYVDGEAWTNGAQGFPSGTDTIEGDFYLVTNPQANVHDDHGHGTHVSGIIAANHDNDPPYDPNNPIKSMTGISKGAKIMSIKVLDSSGIGYYSNLIEGINYASKNGAKIINMSLGGPSKSLLLQEAIDNAYKNGVTIFAAVGNDGNMTVNYPAACNNVTGVGATNNSDNLAGFSNYNSTVDISAPGVGIISTLPTYNVSLKGLGIGNLTSLGNYDFLSGTSMATPMVAGTAALIKSLHPTYTPAQIEMLLKLGNDLGPKGRDNYYGYARLNAYKTLIGDHINPTTPVISSVTHSSSLKYYSNNDPALKWSATDNLGVMGYSYKLDRNSSTRPSGLTGTKAQKSYNNVKDGKWYFHVRAIDYFNNYSPTAHFSFNVDTYKPRTAAPRTARVKRGSNTRLYYKVSDPYTAGKAKVKIIIKLKNKNVAQYNLGTKKINKLTYYNYRAKPRGGTYKFYIFATDLAGNSQYNIAGNTLKIIQSSGGGSNGGGSNGGNSGGGNGSGSGTTPTPSPSPAPSPSPSPAPAPSPIPLPLSMARFLELINNY